LNNYGGFFEVVMQGNGYVKGTVMIVEDFRDTVDILRRLLNRNGYNVDSAESLTEARNKLKVVNPDVILLDINLPDGKANAELGIAKGVDEFGAQFEDFEIGKEILDEIDRLRG
jgi:CheY-like chemotaxis protein